MANWRSNSGGSASQELLTQLPVGSRLYARLDSSFCINVPISGGSGTATSSWHTTTVFPKKFNAVEIFFANKTASPVLYDSVAVASSSSLAAPKTPDGAWTVNTTGVTVPAGTALLPAIASMGAMAVRSIDRTDGGNGYILAVRNYTTTAAASFNSYAVAGQGLTEYNLNNTLRPIYAFAGAGDNVSTNQAGFTGAASTISMPFITKVTYDSPVATVLVGGDSILQGYGQPGWPAGSSMRDSLVWEAIKILQLAGMSLDMANAGLSGQQFPVFSPMFKAALDVVKPQIVIIPAYTPNQAHTTQADVDAQWQQCMDMAQYSRLNNAEVILVTPFPIDTNNSSQDILRLQIRDRVIASRFLYLDVEQVASNGASPARWATGTSPDGIHPYPSVNYTLGVLLAKIISLM